METRKFVKTFEDLVLQIGRSKIIHDRNVVVTLPDVGVYDKKFISLLNHNGLSYTLQYMKNARSAVYKYISGDSLKNTDCVLLTRDGLPVFLQDWIPGLRKRDKLTIQVVLSILAIGRLFTSVGKLETSSITSPYTGKDTTDVVSDQDIESFVNENNLCLKEKIDDPVFNIRSSVGPQGPAMSSIIPEAKSLPDDLYQIITKFLPQDMIDILDKIRDDSIENPPDLRTCCNQSNIIRKITVVEDKENKNRVIAIFDY